MPARAKAAVVCDVVEAHNTQPRQQLEQGLIRQYSSIKQLISTQNLVGALQQGWALLKDVKAACSEAGTSCAGANRCLVELFIAASLNVILCSAEVPPKQLLQPQSALNAVVQELLHVLRQQPSAAAAQHAGTLVKCLLKIAKTLGQRGAGSSASCSLNGLQCDLQQLLLLLVAAAHLCNQGGLAQQVTLKACQQLPACLQHCMLLVLIQAASIGSITAVRERSNGVSGTKPKAEADAPPLPSAVAVACLQHLAGSPQLGPGCLAVCVECLLHEHHTRPPPATLCLVLAALCTGCEEQLPESTLNALVAAADDASVCLQQSLALELAAAGQPVSSAGHDEGLPSSTARRSRCQQHQTAAPVAGSSPCLSSQQGQGTAAGCRADELLLQAWCINSLLDAGPNLLRAVCPLIVSTAASAVAEQAASEDHQLSVTDVTAKVIAATAACLSRCWCHEQQQRLQQRSSCTTDKAAAAAAAQGRGRSSCRGSCSEQDSCGLGQHEQRLWLLLLQLHSAVQQLIGWQGLHQQISSAGEHRGLGASTCSWLAHKLQLAAVSARGCQAEAAGKCCIDNAFAAALWLLSVQCSCVAATVITCSCSAAVLGRSIQPTQDVLEQLSQAAAAVQAVLQLAKPYLNYASARLGTIRRAAATITANDVSWCAACSYLSAQEVMQSAVRLMLLLPSWEQQLLEQRWQSTLRSYGRLRCAAAAYPSSTGDADATHSRAVGCLVHAAMHSAVQAQPAQWGQQPVGEVQQSPPASVLQLATHTSTSGTAVGASLWHPGLDRLCWLEGAALWQTCASAGDSPLAGAALQLLQELTQTGMALCSSAEQVQQAQLLVACSMVLLLLAGARYQSRDWQEQALHALTQASAVFDRLQITAPTATRHQQNTTSAAVANWQAENSTAQQSAGPIGGVVQGSARSSARRCVSSSRRAGPRQPRQRQCSSVHDGPAAKMHTAGVNGCAVAAFAALASAGLCHCLLALVLAQDTLCSSRSSSKPSSAVDMRGPECSPAACTGLGTAAGTGDEVVTGTDCGPAVSSPQLQDSASLWHNVAVHMQQSSALLAACLPTALEGSGTCGGKGLRPARLCYAEETADAVIQAWHIAGLQDWWQFQQSFGDVLVRLSSAAQPHLQQQLLPWLQLLQPGPARDCCSWLCSLVQRQGLGVSKHQPGAIASSDPDAASSPTLKSDCNGNQCMAQTLPRCACHLMQHQDTLAASSLQCLQQANSSGWPSVVQHIQLQLAAAEAAACLGDTAKAAAAAELALQQCKAVLRSNHFLLCKDHSAGSSASCSITDTMASLQLCLSSTTACSPGVQWHALGLYMSSMLRLAGVLDTIGDPRGAVRLLKDLDRVSCGVSCFSFAALAQARLSAVQSCLAEQGKAVAAAAAAEAMLQGMASQQQREQMCGTEEQQHSALYGLAAAAVAVANAAVACGSQQHAEAQVHLTAGLKALDKGLQGSGAQHLAWPLIDMQAQLHLRLAQSHMLLEAPDAAAAQLQQAIALLESLGGTVCSRCPCGPWPVTWACAQLQLLVLCPPKQLAASSPTSSLAVVGFQSSSHNNDLLAEFTTAACSGAGACGSKGDSTDTTAAASSSSSRASSSSRPRRSQTQRAVATAALDAPGVNAAPSRTRRTRSRQAASCRSEDSTAEQATISQAGNPCADASLRWQSAAAQDTAAWLSTMLQVVPLLAQQPLLLRAACVALSQALSASGAVAAATLFQHMSTGASITQQQLVVVSTRLLLSQHARQSDINSSSGHSAAPAAEAMAQQSWKDLQPRLGYEQVLLQMADAAQQAAGSDSAAALQQLSGEVDEAASQWLQAALGQLTPGTAVCSISTAPAAAGTDGQQPLLIAGHWPVPSASALHRAGPGSRVVVSRMLCPADHQPAMPLLVQLPLPSECGKHQEADISGLLQELQDLLSDSATSMEAGREDTSSAAGKAKWWRQRQAQDKRMAALLQQLNQHVLGPWRCLLMQPVQPDQEAAAAAASGAFVSECFDCVLDDKSKQLLVQLVTLLLVNYEVLTAMELSQALQDLSTLAQLRMDGLHLQRLLTELAAAHAATQQAAPASTGAQQTASASSATCSPAAASKSAVARSTQELHAATSKGTAPPAASDAPVVTLAGQAGRTIDPSAALGTSSAVPPVPPSIARHANRRGRLKLMQADTGSKPTAGQRASALQQLVPARAAAVGGGGCNKLSPIPCSTPATGHCTALQYATPAASRTTAAQGSSRLAIYCCTVQQSPGHAHSKRCSTRVHAPTAEGVHDVVLQQWQPSVVLVLDDNMQQLPWESCGGLKGHDMHRCPSLAYAAALAMQATHLGAARVLKLSDSYYLLNPGGDLAVTQKTFEGTLQQLCSKGDAGSCPAPNRLVSELQQHDVFLYFGHGAGEQHLPLSALRTMGRCATSCLMGCSSGRLRHAGSYEACGPIWSYLLAGSPAVIANLWDVTDRDIDRFAMGLLQCWTQDGLEPPARQQRTTAQTRACTVTGSSATSKTSKGSTASDKPELTQERQTVSLCAAVTASRSACRLPHLIGAAVVCYGLPTLSISAG